MCVCVCNILQSQGRNQKSKFTCLRCYKLYKLSNLVTNNLSITTYPSMITQIHCSHSNYTSVVCIWKHISETWFNHLQNYQYFFILENVSSTLRNKSFWTPLMTKFVSIKLYPHHIIYGNKYDVQYIVQ